VLLTSIVFPLAAETMSPGLTERPLGRFSVAPTTPTTLIGSPIRAIAAIAELHLGHFRAGLQRDAAAVERDGLANDAEGRPGRGGWLVAQRDQRRLLVGPLGDGSERPHRAVEDPVAPLDLDGQVLDLVGQPLGVLAQCGRGQVVGRAVLQVARFVDGFCEDSRLIDGRGLLALAAEDQRFKLLGRLALVVLARPVRLEAVVGQQRPLDQGRGHRGLAVRCLPAQALGR
jgi:hypothetical protein